MVKLFISGIEVESVRPKEVGSIWEKPVINTINDPQEIIKHESAEDAKKETILLAKEFIEKGVRISDILETIKNELSEGAERDAKALGKKFIEKNQDLLKRLVDR